MAVVQIPFLCRPGRILRYQPCLGDGIFVVYGIATIFPLFTPQCMAQIPSDASQSISTSTYDNSLHCQRHFLVSESQWSRTSPQRIKNKNKEIWLFFCFVYCLFFLFIAFLFPTLRSSSEFMNLTYVFFTLDYILTQQQICFNIFKKFENSIVWTSFPFL